MNDFKDKILIGIRAYNEAENLPVLIKKIIEEGYKNILIVDDASTDETPTIIKKLYEKYKKKGIKIIYIRHIKNTHMGGALLTELKVAYKLKKNLITLDGDLQHDPKDIKNFRGIENYDILIGNRYYGKTYKLPFHRKILHFLNFLFNFMLSGKKVRDIHNGFRAYNINSIPIFIKELQYFDGSYADNIFYIISKYNLKYKEVPVTIKYTEETLKKGQKVHKTFIKILIKSFLLRFNDQHKVLLLAVILSLVLSIIVLIPSLFGEYKVSFFILFLLILGLIDITLTLWRLYTKKDKELKNLITDESIKLVDEFNT